MAKPRLVAVAGIEPWAHANGYAVRVAGLARELTTSWDLTLVTPQKAGSTSPPERWDVCDVISVPFDGGDAWAWARAAGPAVDRLLRGETSSPLLLWSGSEALAFDRPELTFIADRVDCMALTAWRASLVSRSGRNCLRALRDSAHYANYERRFMQRAYATVVVGEDDARVLRRLGGGASVHVVPNGVAVPAVQYDEAPVPTVVFSGVLDFPPNEDAACYFADVVWPLVRAEVPDARFVIAGRTPTRRVADLAQRPGIDVLADVPDMAPVIGRAWVAVAPMRSGSGVKNKVLEAWAAGRPVVMSPLAANGLRRSAEASESIATGGGDMVAAVVRLLRDSEQRRVRGESMRALVMRDHGWGAAATRLSALIEAAGPSRSRAAERSPAA